MLRRVGVVCCIMILAACGAKNETADVPKPAVEDNRMTKVAEPAFEGFLVLRDSLNIFYECSSGAAYLVECDDDMKTYLTNRYQEISKAPEEEVYVQFRGDKADGMVEINEEALDGVLTVRSVIAFREKRDSDCVGD